MKKYLDYIYLIVMMIFIPTFISLWVVVSNLEFYVYDNDELGGLFLNIACIFIVIDIVLWMIWWLSGIVIDIHSWRLKRKEKKDE